MSKKQYAEQILKNISRANPYTSQDKTQGALWAAGYLAGYLAQLSEEDPWVYRRFILHVSAVERRSNIV